MKIGVCIGRDLWKAEILKKYGYDFAELCVTDFGLYDESQYEEYKEKVKNCGLPCISANCFLPGDLKINRLQRDETALRNYVETVAKRAEELGVERIIFGSGGARKCPDEMKVEDCIEDIRSFIEKTVAPEFSKHGIKLIIEPLARVLCNTISTVKEGIQFVEEIGLDNVLCLADNFHMDHNGESFSSLYECKGKIAHAHISVQDITMPKYRRYFPKYDDGYDVSAFISPILQSGCEYMAIEADNKDETFEEDAKQAIEIIKKAIMKG